MLVVVMTAVQIIMALGAICYCRGSVLIPDEISPLSGLIGHLEIPRTSTFTSMVSRSSFVKADDSIVRAWFSLKKEHGIRRWILMFEHDDLGLKEQELTGKGGSELKGVQSEV